MKLFNYSTLSLLFTTIMQAVAGYTCPNISTVNTRITENDTMRFPLSEGGVEPSQEVFFEYRADDNRIGEFYTGKRSEVEQFLGVYYHLPTEEREPTLTCTYKQKDNRYLLLPLTKKGARQINGAAIGNDIDSNWRAFRNHNRLFVCGDGTMEEDNLGNCQFYLKPR